MKAEKIDENTLALGPFGYDIVAELPEYYIAKQRGVTGWSKQSDCNLIFVHKETLDVARMLKSKSPMEII